MNTQTTPRVQSRTRGSLLRVVHRIAGLCVALPVLLLVATGLPLQFTDGLELGSRGVPFDLAHRAYGLQAPSEAVADGQVIQVGGRLLVGQRDLAIDGVLRGALNLEEVWIVATTEILLLVPKQPGVPEETLPLPGVVERLGSTQTGALAIEADGAVLTSEDFGVTWQAANTAERIDWQAPRWIPISENLARRYRATHLSWERWLQDLHSGRFFGPIGEWVMNLAGVALLLLALSGSVVWWRNRG